MSCCQRTANRGYQPKPISQSLTKADAITLIAGVSGEVEHCGAGPVKPLPEFGTAEDFPLQQALNQLRGLPVMASKTAAGDQRAEAPTTPTK